jgi:PAS domain S-box-containing protein
VSDGLGSKEKRVIHPIREAILAGLIVCGAICLGASVVYLRAKETKVDDVRAELTGSAKRLARIFMRAHERVRRREGDERRQIYASQTESLLFARDNMADVRRIYTFSFEEGAKRTFFDTGTLGDDVTGVPASRDGERALPPHGARALEAYRSGGAEVGVLAFRDGLLVSAFEAMRDPDGNVQGVLGIESNVDRLGARLSSIRHAALVASGMGLALGGVFGGFVWKTRRRAANAVWRLERAREVEHAIVESLGEVIYEMDTSNPAWRLRWRGDLKALMGEEREALGDLDAWRARIHPQDLAQYDEALKRAVAGHGAISLEYRVRSRSGEYLLVHDRGHPVRGGGGLMVGALFDLTARRSAEETFRLFFQETATALLLFEGDDISKANPAAAKLFRARDVPQLLATPLWKFWPKRQLDGALSADGWSRHVLHALESGGSHFEWEFVRTSGEELVADVFLNSAQLSDRPVLLLACYDLTAMKRAQAGLIESERRFRDVSEAAGEFIWEVDASGVYRFVSPRVSEILARGPEDVVGRRVMDFVPEADAEMVRKRYDEITDSGEPFSNFEHRVVRADGEVIWIRVSGVPVRGKGGEIAGYRGATLDVTDRRRHEEELILQKEAAEAADRAKSNFLAVMSHEIRTPLNSVLGFADLVLRTPLTTRQREYLETIRTSGDALLALLNDILDLSKIESERMEFERRPMHLETCVREVVELYEPAAEEKGLRLAWRIEESVPEQVLTDPSRLRQILLNLVGNAVKFTERGEVHVTVSVASNGGDGRRVRIVVEDTGIGIPADKFERLFKPFSQVDSSTTRRFGGTGLGLAISKRLAELLGGDLGILYSGPVGTAFYLDVPLLEEAGTKFSAPEAPEAQESSQPGGDGVGAGLRVLVVDDNPMNRKLAVHLLRQIGVETVDAAADAERCFERLAEEQYDLIFMDVQMPGMDGLEATRRIRAQKAESGTGRPVRVVALTADAMVGDRERCLRAGMDDYLGKPIRRERLAAVLADVQESKSKS